MVIQHHAKLCRRIKRAKHDRGQLRGTFRHRRRRCRHRHEPRANAQRPPRGQPCGTRMPQTTRQHQRMAMIEFMPRSLANLTRHWRIDQREIPLRARRCAAQADIAHHDIAAIIRPAIKDKPRLLGMKTHRQISTKGRPLPLRIDQDAARVSAKP